MLHARMKMPTESADRYIEHLQTASPDQIELARLFQRLAFPDRTFDDKFVPAPLYVEQAMSLSHENSQSERKQLFKLIRHFRTLLEQ